MLVTLYLRGRKVGGHPAARTLDDCMLALLPQQVVGHDCKDIRQPRGGIQRSVGRDSPPSLTCPPPCRPILQKFVCVPLSLSASSLSPLPRYALPILLCHRSCSPALAVPVSSHPLPPP